MCDGNGGGITGFDQNLTHLDLNIDVCHYSTYLNGLKWCNKATGLLLPHPLPLPWLNHLFTISMIFMHNY